MSKVQADDKLPFEASVSALEPQIEVNLKRIGDNLNIIKSYSSSQKVCAMVKANAYGHGLIEVARFLQDKVDYLGVARSAEALAYAEQE